MERILGTVNGGQEQADKNLNELQEAFPNFEFEIRPHDTRHQIILKNASVTTPVPDVERMQRFAQGIETSEKRSTEMTQELKEDIQQNVRGQDSGMNTNSSGPLRSGT